MRKSLLVKYLPFISLIFHRSTRSDPSVHFSVVVPDNVSWCAVNRAGMGCERWLRGNSPAAGLCFRAGLQAHPALSRDRVAPEWTRGDGARTDLLSAGRLGPGCLLGFLCTASPSWLFAGMRAGSEVKILVSNSATCLSCLSVLGVWSRVLVHSVPSTVHPGTWRLCSLSSSSHSCGRS